MNIALILVIALVLFWLGYRFYATYISRVFGQDDSRETPAVCMEDGCDYVPTKPMVVFGHHFASIAGAGPIVGPAVALIYGWGPTLFWIVLGTIFIGAVHDHTSLMASVREKGHSIAELAKDNLGQAGFFLLISFTLVIVLIVCAAFLNLTAVALTSEYPLQALGLDQSQSIFDTVYKTNTGDYISAADYQAFEEGTFTPPADMTAKLAEGTELSVTPTAIVGGIASTQVIAITFFAPLVGFLLYKKKSNVWLVSLLSIIVIGAALWIGLNAPLRISPDSWKIAFSVYTLIAAGIPVWIILQPRDFTNSFILYAGIIILVLAVLIGGIRGVPLQLGMNTVAQGVANKGPIWPMMFIIIACGAISGFHALVSGGTSSKQISKESHVKPIGYGGMVLEGILAVTVILAIGAGLTNQEYIGLMYTSGVKANPILAFAVGMGGLLYKSLGIPASYGTIFGVVMIEGFIATTLDTAVRLSRYLFEELWNVVFVNPPAFMKTYFFNATLAVVIMLGLAWGNAFMKIWDVFGAGNQLLAALTLMAVSVWLIRRNKPAWFTIIPGVFMMCTTLYALFYLLFTKYLPAGDVALITADVLLIALSFGTVIISIGSVRQHLRNPQPEPV